MNRQEFGLQRDWVNDRLGQGVYRRVAVLSEK
jgi:hypothetical protein